MEYVTIGGQTVVIMEQMGEKLGKAGAKKAVDRALDGGNIITYTELILAAQGAAGLSGQLIPDISCYLSGFTYNFRGTTPRTRT